MTPKSVVLALALGAALAGNANAQNAITPAQQKELDAARADLEKASQRYAELARKSGAAIAPIRIERREIRRPVIGVLLAGDDKPGVRIVGVTPDSAAAGAGLKGGDRIVRINDKAIDAPDGGARVAQARAMLAKPADAKTPVNLAYERDGKTTTVTMTPRESDRLFFMSGLPNSTTADGNVRFFTNKDGEIDAVQAKRITIDTDEVRARANAATMVAPEVRREIMRIDSDCKGSDCKLPALVEALRWSGVNLATVDAGLGRYFGTDRGVLVLGTGKDLSGLQAGDVIRTIDGKAVNTPREAMDALRARPADSKVAVGYLRDRKEGSVEVTIPKAAAPFRITMPPNASHVVEKRRYVMKDKDGRTLTWEGGPNDTPPSWVKDADKDGQHIERRKIMEVEDRSRLVTPPATPRID